MGNYCSSSSKKDKDNISDKSEESPSYQLAKSKKLNGSKEAPLADPEPTSDISNQLANYATLTTNNGHNASLKKSVPAPLDSIADASGGGVGGRAPKTLLHSVASDSITNSPLTGDAPCDLPAPPCKSPLPATLQPLHGVPGKVRRTERDRKIVLYVLAADGGHAAEKQVLRQVVANVSVSYAARGYEVQLCDAHEHGAVDDDWLDASAWTTAGPMEARGGHQTAAPCLAEIARHSKTAYFIPILFLGTSLGSPLLPLTIEKLDFRSALTAAHAAPDRDLLEQWYVLDESAMPPCYRLQTDRRPTPAEGASTGELRRLLNVFVEHTTKELRDSYLTTLVEQQINNTVLINQDHSKRCIWTQTGSWPNRLSESADALDSEQNRRLCNLHAELKNQLLEKNLIRIPPTVQVQPGQLAALFETLLVGLLDGICDEHVAKCQIPRCTFGVDANLLHEIEAVNQYSAFLEQNCVNFDIMDRIKSYVTNPSTEPLVVYGKSGCGKSVLSAKVAQNIHTWLPSCSFIIRYTNLTPLSSDIVSIVGSIAEQVCYLTKAKSCIGPHTIEFYANTIRDCLEPPTTQQLCILVDSIDAAQLLDTLDWLPLRLHENVKIILTITDGTEQLQWLRTNLSADSLLKLDHFTDAQWLDVLRLVGTGRELSAPHSSQPLPDEWLRCADKVPLQAKIYWWLSWLGEFPVRDTTLDACCARVFDSLEQRFGEPVVRYTIALLVASRYGLMETELLQLLAEAPADWASNAGRVWTQFSWIMAPMLLHTDRIRLVDRKLHTVALQRYATALPSAHRQLVAFYERQPDEYATPAGRKHVAANRAKFCELPYHTFKLDASAFAGGALLTDIEWIYRKLSATGGVQLLSDLHLLGAARLGDSVSLRLLRVFVELNMRPLNYDARQFYSLMPAFVRQQCEADATLRDDTVLAAWLQHFERIPIAYFETLGNLELLNEQRRKGSTVAEVPVAAVSGEAVPAPSGYDAVMNLGGEGYYVASLSVAREEICVWDVGRCVRVRTLRGIPQPTALCPVGDFGAAVLCRREIKVIDLDEGAFKVTLKGVMNQKMPFFGQHDAQHLVCLSRNRMYVNLMNLESGDCVTTFKAGEDRFLNSLLVSGDGRILVCGDETQKPFPLLVWHLSQRKLLYDLRIPHHDFVTSLSAITHEGAYVAVVAKELNEPTPNFIVVYDLQSGTLFKKWKPTCNTVALAISQTQTCVIAGLDDARILIWDLVTGNCKYTLFGHAAPVTLLKLDPTGRVLLSADREGRDLSVRVWALASGQSLAVYTPIEKITTCEILPNGRYVVLALHDHPNLVTLKLHQPVVKADADGDDEDDEAVASPDEPIVYGKPENEGKVVQL